MQINLDLKMAVHAAVLAEVEARMAAARETMDAAQESANNETKSSMGDKYETGRAMAQRAHAQAAQQLAQARNLKQILSRIDPAAKCRKVTLGALVQCTMGVIYCAVATGRLEVNGTAIFSISPASLAHQRRDVAPSGHDPTHRPARPRSVRPHRLLREREVRRRRRERK